MLNALEQFVFSWRRGKEGNADLACHKILFLSENSRPKMLKFGTENFHFGGI